MQHEIKSLNTSPSSSWQNYIHLLQLQPEFPPSDAGGTAMFSVLQGKKGCDEEREEFIFGAFQRGL
jgi:hypothetical protein